MARQQDVRADLVEAKKARFLTAYKALCREFGMMAAMTPVTDDGEDVWPSERIDLMVIPNDLVVANLIHTVVDVNEDPVQLDEAIEQMLIEEVRYASPG